MPLSSPKRTMASSARRRLYRVPLGGWLESPCFSDWLSCWDFSITDLLPIMNLEFYLDCLDASSRSTKAACSGVASPWLQGVEDAGQREAGIGQAFCFLISSRS